MADEESVLRNRLLEDIVNNEGEDGGTAKKAWQPDNLMVLYVTAALFGGFVIAEIVGALVSDSIHKTVKQKLTVSTTCNAKCRSEIRFLSLAMLLL